MVVVLWVRRNKLREDENAYWLKRKAELDEWERQLTRRNYAGRSAKSHPY